MSSAPLAEGWDRSCVSPLCSQVPSPCARPWGVSRDEGRCGPCCHRAHSLAISDALCSSQTRCPSTTLYSKPLLRPSFLPTQSIFSCAPDHPLPQGPSIHSVNMSEHFHGTQCRDAKEQA